MQSEAHETGIERLWLDLGQLRNAETVVALRPWDSNWRGFAEHIWRVSDRADVIIQVYAYSWGAGYGFPKLARELMKRGMKIRHAVLSDPVYKPPLFSLSWLALTRFGRITVPENVGAVDSYYQRRNRPWGRPVVIENGTGPRHRVTEKKISGYLHVSMDDAEEFHERAKEAAREIF